MLVFSNPYPVGSIEYKEADEIRTLILGAAMGSAFLGGVVGLIIGLVI